MAIQWGLQTPYMATGAYQFGSAISAFPQTTFQMPFGGVTMPSIFNYTPMPMVTPVAQGISSYSFGNIFNMLPSYTAVQSYLDNWCANIMAGLSNVGTSIASTAQSAYTAVKTTASKVATSISNFGSKMISTARKYLGFNEKDGSYKKFTAGRVEAWCADFVSYVARECGLSNFNFPSVQGILNWGKSNGKFSKTAKVGDVIIFKGTDRNGKRVSHTGIVTAVENGKIKTIEGNTSDKVAERSYSLTDSRITGFVSLA